jgi:predicted Rossmann-fold nucleotide-binding protein
MHVTKTGKQSGSRRENVARGVHDTCILNAMKAFLQEYEQTQVVGVMGGHAMLRTEESYRQTVLISKKLTEEGFLMLSGGGPGAMEATHLGAWMAGRTEEEVDEALKILAPAPNFKSPNWLSTAFDVISRFPQKEYKSLAIPTWYYGHEPPTVFATHIAKFFNNSIREDTILTEAYGGLIYMPGSAGTLQEIFQEAVQDHYVSLGYASPMVFVGKKYWTETVPVWPFIQYMMKAGHYKNLVLDLCDTVDEIVESILDFRFSRPKKQ